MAWASDKIQISDPRDGWMLTTHSLWIFVFYRFLNRFFFFFFFFFNDMTISGSVGKVTPELESQGPQAEGGMDSHVGL